jgi:hypothetical protein
MLLLGRVRLRSYGLLKAISLVVTGLQGLRSVLDDAIVFAFVLLVSLRVADGVLNLRSHT